MPLPVSKKSGSSAKKTSNTKSENSAKNQIKAAKAAKAKEAAKVAEAIEAAKAANVSEGSTQEDKKEPVKPESEVASEAKEDDKKTDVAPEKTILIKEVDASAPKKKAAKQAAGDLVKIELNHVLEYNGKFYRGIQEVPQKLADELLDMEKRASQAGVGMQVATEKLIEELNSPDRIKPFGTVIQEQNLETSEESISNNEKTSSKKIKE